MLSITFDPAGLPVFLTFENKGFIIVLDNHLNLFKSSDLMKNKSKLPVVLKITLPFVLTIILVIITIYGFVMPKIDNILFEQKKEKVKDLCKNTLQLAEQYYERYMNGELSKQESQERLVERVRGMRYGDDLKDYFWILDMDYIMIMHPYLPETEGSSMKDYKDPNGNTPFFAMVELVRQNKSGYVEYLWQLRDIEEDIQKKISYVELFEPWHWIIGTGVYYSDIELETSEMTHDINVTLILIVLLIGLISLYIILKEIKNAEYRQQSVLEKEKFILKLKTINDELNQAQKESEEANRSKDIFLATITHDLRTPLNGIVGFSELLEGCSEEERKKRFSEYTGYIQKSGRYLLQMINDILDFSKVEAKKMELVKSEFSINAVLEEVITSLSFFSQEKGIPIAFKADEKLLIRADEMRLKKVFYNLLSNAIKYTKGHQPIDVHLSRSEEGIFVSFRDRGIGISPEDQEKIFKPFVQLNQIKTEGTGLGLAIAKEIVDLHNGAISLKSEYGKGSEFTVRLPVSILTDKVTSAKKTERESFDLAGKKVFVVEDDEISRKLIKLFLEKNKMQPVCASTGEELLILLASDLPDIILMDIRLPDIDGITLRHKVMETVAKKLPIIALTAFSSEEKRSELLQSGFVAVCHKPIDSEDLLGKIFMSLTSGTL
jgi:signal transduction histidine kinase/CheY-like chemotaxis protein